MVSANEVSSGQILAEMLEPVYDSMEAEPFSRRFTA